MKKRLIKFRVVSLAMLTLLLSFLTSTAYAVDFTLQTNSSTFAEGGTNSLVASQSGVTFTYLKGSSGDFAYVPISLNNSTMQIVPHSITRVPEV